MAKRIENIDLDNQEFQNAWNLLQHTHRSVFLTGKAGTGKSTFLRYITSHTKKKYVVLAPTGIAAVNVGGQTLHSFFKIPFKPLLPDDPDFSPRRIRETLRYPRNKVKLLRELDLIVIDEISMVRCDIIDFIDKVLRIYCGRMREPFGGKQLLFVGDIFQLEPVVTRDMRDILKLYYDRSFFFFNAMVFRQLGLIPIELRKIYRQNDAAFIALLDRVRVSHATPADIALLNTRVETGHRTVDEEFTITLATRRDTVDSINEEHMESLAAPEVLFEGEVDGTFPDTDLPTSKELILKQRAQVIFIRNDKEGRWVNGTIGRVADVTANEVLVELEDGQHYSVEQEIWENMQYTYNEKKRKVEEKLLGTFKQLPIKPAWALTVHKSQGLTFNKVVIDFAGGAFTSGQTYVALSRCTSLEGMTLLKPLSERDIIVNPEITRFSFQFNNAGMIGEALERERANGLYTRASLAFDKGDYCAAVDLFTEAMNTYNALSLPAVPRLIKRKFLKIAALRQRIDELQNEVLARETQLRELAMEFVEMGDQASADDHKLDEISIRSAMANYNKALRLMPACLEAHLGKGRLLLAIGEDDHAEDALRTALKLDKNNYEALMLLAGIQRARHDTTATIKAYKRVIKHHSTHPEPYEALAEICSSLDLDDLADEYAEKARQLRERARKKKKGK